MTLTIPPEIAQEIAKHVYTACLKIKAEKKREEELGIAEWDGNHWLVNWTTNLFHLRRVSKSFQYAVDRLFYADLEVKKISNLSMVRLKAALESDSICNAVRTYTFSPHVCLVRPIVRSGPWEYYGEFSNGCGPEPRLSQLEAEHSMRQTVAQHYDEQLRYLGPDAQGLRWFWCALKRLLKNSPPLPRTSLLSTLLCFTQIDRLKNLQKLHLGYSKPRRYTDTWVHYQIKNDISLGLVTILKNAPAPLTSVNLNFPTLTDLKNIVYFARTAQLNPSQIENLTIELAAESLAHNHANDKERNDLHSHITGGQPLADFLAMFDNLQQLELSYENDWAVWGARLILQHFHPKTMRYLRSLSLRGLVINADDLLRLTFEQSGGPMLDLKTMDVRRVALFSDGPTWTDIFDSWSTMWPACDRMKSRLRELGLGYVDMSSCSREDLQRMNSEFIARLTEAHDEDLTEKRWR